MTAMSQPVIIPAYNLTGDRALNCDAVVKHLRAGGFEPLMVAPVNGGTMSHARNLGVELLENDYIGEIPPDAILVFNDADSIVAHRHIREAIFRAKQAPGLVYAYTIYCRSTETATRLYRQQDSSIEALGTDRVITNAPSMGCVAISYMSFKELGGFDQRYVGWGYEDCEFAARAHDLHPVRRVDGALWHLWHGDRNPDDSPTDSNPEMVAENHRLWALTH